MHDLIFDYRDQTVVYFRPQATLATTASIPLAKNAITP